MILQPKKNIAHLPTRIEALQNLSSWLGGPRIYIKRDDQTGLAFGGNKTRKLEYLAADALNCKARTLITTGALQSNHCRQTAACSAQLGLDCVLVLVGKSDADLSGNYLLSKLLGAEIVFAEAGTRDTVLAETYNRLEESGRQPYLIPYGGSNSIGVAGYIEAMQELMVQIQGKNEVLKEPPDWIVFASSSGGTQAGLMLGAWITEFSGEVLGISVEESSETLRVRIAKIVEETAKFLDIPYSIIDSDVNIDDSYLGGGYGVLGVLEREAINLFARYEGILLDPVYTGRAAGGLIDLIRHGFFLNEDRILFWHTGGQPAIFADAYQSQLLSQPFQ